MGYFDGNNDLDVSQAGTSYIIEDVQEMEKVGSTDEVTAVTIVSSLKTGGNANYYLVQKHPDELPDKISSKDLGTKDMSDPQCLKNFIKWAKEEYPADHYALIINDHGGGWRGACVDEQNGAGSLMSMPDIRMALEEGPHFDDINGNENVDAGEGLGWWDINGNGRWDDMFLLNPGDEITNAQVVLQTITTTQSLAKRNDNTF